MNRMIIASLFGAAVLGLTIAGPVSAAPMYGMAGCGLGSIVIGPTGGIVQIFAGTTNGTSGNQTFGITSGTSNCAEDAQAYLDQQRETFLTVNFRGLQQEMAAGKGEKLEAFSHLMGCPADSFGRMAQAQHSELFGAGNATPTNILANVKAAIRSNDALSAVCSAI
jgi:transcription elongation factor